MRGAVNPRRAARFAAIAAAALVAGMLPGTDSAASGPDHPVTVAYNCRFTSGTWPLTAVLTQDYPAVAVAGQPVQPGPLTAAVTVPAKTAAALLPAGTAGVSGTAALTARLTSGSAAAQAVWSGLTAPAAPATGDITLTFTGAVPPVKVTATSATAPPGELRFAAGELAITLHPRTGPAKPPPDSATPTGPATPTATTAAPTPTTATPTATASGDAPAQGATAGSAPADPAAGAGTAVFGIGTETSPARRQPSPAPAATPGAGLGDVTGTCTPRPGAPAVLGTVPLAAADPTPGLPGAAGGASATGRTPAPAGAPAGPRHDPVITAVPPPHSGLHDCPDPPKGDPDPAIIAGLHRPPGAIVSPGPGDPPFPPFSQCGFITGYANVKQLHGASLVNDLAQHPRLANIVQKGTAADFSSDDPAQWYFEIDSIAQLDLPPSRSSFLVYGFLPATAEFELRPRGLMTVITLGSGALGTISTTTVYGQEDLRLYDVSLDGTPMDVGPDCHTVTPLDIRLVGYDRSSLTGVPTRPQDYSVQTGGPLAQDDLSIPRFAGCGSHGEDFDALLTSAVSGGGNSLNLIQGPLCVPVAQSGCDPEIAFPQPPHH